MHSTIVSVSLKLYCKVEHQHHGIRLQRTTGINHVGTNDTSPTVERKNDTREANPRVGTGYIAYTDYRNEKTFQERILCNTP